MDKLQKAKLEWLLEKKELKNVEELINYVLYLEDVKKDYEFLKSEVLRVAKVTGDLY